MPAALFLGLQAVAGPPAPTRPRPPIERSCPADADSSGDIVVCGRADQEGLRLRPLPEPEQRASVKAEVGLFGRAKAAAETEQGNVGGLPSNRIMLRLKLPF